MVSSLFDMYFVYPTFELANARVAHFLFVVSLIVIGIGTWMLCLHATVLAVDGYSIQFAHSDVVKNRGIRPTRKRK